MGTPTSRVFIRYYATADIRSAFSRPAASPCNYPNNGKVKSAISSTLLQSLIEGRPVLYAVTFAAGHITILMDGYRAFRSEMGLVIQSHLAPTLIRSSCAQLSTISCCPFSPRAAGSDGR